MARLRLLLVVCLAALWAAPSQGRSWRGTKASTAYPLIDYRPRYHLTCQRGKLENPSMAFIRDKASLEYHVFYHCTSLNASALPSTTPIPIDEWYHTSSANLMQWVPAITKGIPKGTKSISIVQPTAETTEMVAVTLGEDGIYLGRSTDPSLVSWKDFSKGPIITPPEGATAFEEPHIWVNEPGTTYYLLVGSSISETSVSSTGQAQASQVPVTYLYESSDLSSWAPRGVFWKGDTTFGPSARSVDYYSVFNAGLQFEQQVMTITFDAQGEAFCLSGEADFATFNGFSVKSLRHADYGNLRSACSILDMLGRRLVIGKVEEQRSDGWVAHDGYSGAVSLPRIVLSLPNNEVGFDVPEDVSNLYGKPLGRLTGLSLDDGETESMPLLQGNQITISATLTVTPTAEQYSAGFRLLASTNFSEYTIVAVASDPASKPLDCMAVPTSHGMDRPGDDYTVFSVDEDSDAPCKQACCNDPACKSWVFAFSLPSTITNCTTGSHCCFLKSTVPPLSPSLLNLTSGVPQTPNGILSVDTRKSSLNPEFQGEEVHVPLQYTPPNLEPPSLHRQAKTAAQQDKTTVHNKHDELVGGVRDSEAVNFKIFIDHSILEVFVHDALVITERVYPTLADSLNVQLFAFNCTVSFAIEGYDMQATI